jgi:hypothetical protein
MVLARSVLLGRIRRQMGLAAAHAGQIRYKWGLVASASRDSPSTLLESVLLALPSPTASLSTTSAQSALTPWSTTEEPVPVRWERSRRGRYA